MKVRIVEYNENDKQECLSYPTASRFLYDWISERNCLNELIPSLSSYKKGIELRRNKIYGKNI